ncbi:MAG: hypothetical protein AB7G39_16925 [Alphaproteobacteria bacterium]
MPDRVRRRITTRYVAMNAFDDAMFSFALREEFPTIRFYRDGTLREPRIRWYETIAEIGLVARAVVPEDSGWEPLILPERYYYRAFNWPDWDLRCVRNDWYCGGIDHRLAFDPPTTQYGMISINHGGDPAMKPFLAGVRRALRRVTSDRYRLGRELDRFISVKQVRPMPTWVGYSLLQWCQQAPRRMFHGGYRPCDDWTLPDDPWYAATAEKVRALYANDLTEPPVDSPYPNPTSPLAIRRDAAG